jgi:pyruvate,orthophosphate dikinase
MKIGIASGRGIKPNMEIGICGEHGGDPNSIKFCHNENLSYVSASPHRIPIAIIAAAQAAIEQPKKATRKQVKKATRKQVKKATRSKSKRK